MAASRLSTALAVLAGVVVAASGAPHTGKLLYVTFAAGGAPDAPQLQLTAHDLGSNSTTALVTFPPRVVEAYFYQSSLVQGHTWTLGMQYVGNEYQGVLVSVDLVSAAVALVNSSTFLAIYPDPAATPGSPTSIIGLVESFVKNATDDDAQESTLFRVNATTGATTALGALGVNWEPATAAQTFDTAAGVAYVFFQSADVDEAVLFGVDGYTGAILTRPVIPPTVIFWAFDFDAATGATYGQVSLLPPPGELEGVGDAAYAAALALGARARAHRFSGARARGGGALQPSAPLPPSPVTLSALAAANWTTFLASIHMPTGAFTQVGPSGAYDSWSQINGACTMAAGDGTFFSSMYDHATPEPSEVVVGTRVDTGDVDFVMHVPGPPGTPFFDLGWTP